MRFEHLTDGDRALVSLAAETSDRLYLRGWHEVAAAVRTTSGHVFSAIHLDTPAGDNVCGEVAAVCCMIAGGHRDLETVCAVWRDHTGSHFLLPPCGKCREVIRALNQEAWVIVSTAANHWERGAIDRAGKIRISELLPMPYR